MGAGRPLGGVPVTAPVRPGPEPPPSGPDPGRRAPLPGGGAGDRRLPGRGTCRPGPRSRAGGPGRGPVDLVRWRPAPPSGAATRPVRQTLTAPAASPGPGPPHGTRRTIRPGPRGAHLVPSAARGRAGREPTRARASGAPRRTGRAARRQLHRRAPADRRGLEARRAAHTMPAVCLCAGVPVGRAVLEEAPARRRPPCGHAACRRGRPPGRAPARCPPAVSPSARVPAARSGGAHGLPGAGAAPAWRRSPPRRLCAGAHRVRGALTDCA